LQNSVSLNLNVFGFEVIGRVMGYINYGSSPSGTNQTSNNHARSDMTIFENWTSTSTSTSNGNSKQIDPNPTGEDGATINVATFNTQQFWDSLGFTTTNWDFSANRLPTLKGMPPGTQNPHVRQP
jgi:hypothetical protein